MVRRQLEIGDEWDQKVFFNDEKRAQQDLAWLSHHNGGIREFKLVAAAAPTTLSEELNDEIPF